MNRGIHKIIFNRSRGCLMAVAETTIAQGKSPAERRSASVALPARRGLHLLAFSFMLLSGQALIIPAASAQIIADSAAPRQQQPTVLPAANGIPQVNIQTPSAAGVSVNQYRQFDISSQGAILNNSRRNTLTRLGGWVQGNPWLAAGEAKIIVNQVNNASPSLLSGYIEVAGRRAEVVVANPAGIQVNGGGFINASGVTLTTGAPVPNNGHLVSFLVRKGQIGVSGQGLDTSDVDYIRILSQAAQIHSGIWGKDILISAGSHRMAADGTSEAVSGSPGATVPAIAIDTGVLGGMYAGKITLISHDTGASIRHAGQSFAGAGGISLSADGKIYNSGSMVAADKNSQGSGQATVNVRADSLDNSGTLSAQGTAAIHTQTLNNSGLLSSLNALHVENSSQLDNSGTLEGGRLDVVSGSLDNRGRILQTGLQKLAVDSRILNNHQSGMMGYLSSSASASGAQAGGTFGSGHSAAGGGQASLPPSGAAGGGQITVSPSLPAALSDGVLRVTERLDNRGEIAANGGITLTAKQGLTNTGKLQLDTLKVDAGILDNNRGTVAAGQADLALERFDNRQGRFTAFRLLNAHSRVWDNRQGVLQSAGSLHIRGVNLNNAGGTIAANQRADIESATVDNRGGSLDAGRLVLGATSLHNQAGHIRSDELTRLQLAAHLDNQGGHIGSARKVEIHDRQTKALAIDNTGGEIVSGRDMALQAKSLRNNGLIDADRDLSVLLKDSFTTDSAIRAGGALHIGSERRLVNRHRLSGGDSVTIQAADIDNTADGAIQSERHTRLTAAGQLNNRGLINSNGLTRLEAGGTLTNTGSGRIYGDDVALGAVKVENHAEQLGGQTRSAVVAARRYLAVGARHISNRDGALLSGMEGLSVGARLDERQHPQDKADSLLNSGGRIESGGDMHLAVEKLRNENPRLKLEEYVAERIRGISEYAPQYEDVRYRARKDGYFDNSGGSDDQRNAGFHFNDGRPTRVAEHWHVWQYDSTTYKQRVVDSAPGEIIAGGNLHASGSDWINADSRVMIGGSLEDAGLNGGKLESLATQGQGRIEHSGSTHLSTWKRRWYSGKRRPRRVERDYRPYHHEEAFTHGFAQPVTVYQTHAAVPAPSGQVATAAEAPSHAANSTAGSRAAVQTVAAPTVLPANSLYTIRPDHHSYLVETDPAFADYRQWLGSDYMLKALGQDGHSLHKRLGDGYYEQRLVNEQIARLTGYRRLDGYQNDEDQFKALMNQGITFAREQRLVPGISLSPEQVARLTSDIVWLERQTLTLDNGSSQTVLVPKVYLAVRPGDVQAHGGLISAEQVVYRGGEGTLHNRGTIAGRKLVDLSAAQIDHSGRITGGQVDLAAQGSLLIEGGTVEAARRLHAEAEHIRLASTALSSGDADYGQTRIDRVAGLYITGADEGTLNLHARQNLSLDGAVVSNRSAGGRTRLQAETGDLSLGTVGTASHERIGHSDDANHRHIRRSAEAGSRLETDGNLQLIAGGDISVRQGYLNSEQGNITLHAERDLKLEEGRRSLELDEASTHRDKGLFSRRTTQNQYRLEEDQAVSGSITGQSVTLRAGANLHIRGTDAVSDDSTRLEAGGNIDIEAARHRRQENLHRRTSRSGLSAGFKSGALQIGYARQQNRLQQAEDQESPAAQQIGSLKGHTVLFAGGNVRTRAAQLAAGQDLMIEGNNIELGAAYVNESSQQQQHTRSSGINLSLNLKPAEVRQLEKQVGRVRNTAAQSGAVNKWRAWDSGGIQAAVEPFMPAGGMSATRSNSRSNDTHTQIRAVGSSANAGGQVILHARAGDADLIGSQAFGQKGLNISASGNIHIVAAEEQRQHSAEGDSKTSGLTQGDSVFSRFIGNRTDRSREDGSRILHNGSVVGSGSGATVLTAGRRYTQTGSQVLSDGDIGIRAQNITVQAADNPYHRNHYHSHTQKGLTVGLSTPVTDAVQAAQKTAEAVDRVGRSNNNRTNAMAAANAGWQGCQAAQSIRGQAAGGNNTGSGINVSITYGEQRNSQERHSSGHTAQGAQILGRGQVGLSARGTGPASDIRISGAEIAGQSGTRLEAEGDIRLQAARQTHRETGRSRQAGWKAGVALDFSNGVSVGVTGGGNHGKGRSESEAVRHLHSRIGSAGSRTALTSGGDTTLQGVRVPGQGIALDARNLHIESLQDSARHSGSQYHGQGQITVGYGFSADGSYQQSQLNADHQSVAEQSGLYAGDDGFQVSVKEHTGLKGGLIVSGEAAESAGRNRFVSGSLSSSDLANHSRYSGRSFGIGAGLEVSGQSLGQGSNKPSGPSTVAEQDSVSSSLGYGRDSDSQSSVTRSGIGTRNIHITAAAAQQAHTGHSPEQAAAAVYTELRLGSADAQAGYLNNRFDAERVQNEIDLQTSVSQQFSQTSRQIGTEINRQAKEHHDTAKQLDQAAAKADEEGNTELAQTLAAQADDERRKAANWQRSGVLLDMISAGLSTPTQSTAGIAAATASPMISYEIGQYFKGKNAEGTSAHILAHAVLGAAVAAAGDNSAIVGAISAGGAEAAAPTISHYLYNEQDGSKLTVEQKETVTAITGLLGTAIGAAVGNTTADAVQGNLNAGNAVENNYVVSIISKGRRAVRAAQTGRGLIPKDALPVAEAGLLVAAACVATRNCDASQVLQDIWSGKFEDSYMASDNENNGSGEKASVQSAVSQTSAGSPIPDPDFEPNGESKTHNRDGNIEVNELLNNSTQRSNRNSLSQYDRNLTNQQNAWQQANKDFDSLKLRNVRTFQTRYGQGRIGTLSDGCIVNVRPGSSNGQTTIEIQNPTSNRVVKIRY